MAFCLCGTKLISYSFKPFGESSKSHSQIDDNFLTWAASAGSITNGFARLFFGTMIDRFSFKLLMGVILTAEFVMCLLFYVSAHIPGLYFALILVNYAIVGGFFVVLPVSTTRTFGLKLGPQVFALNFGGVLASLINLSMTHWLLPATSYLTLYLAGAAVTFCSLVVLFFTKEELDV